MEHTHVFITSHCAQLHFYAHSCSVCLSPSGRPMKLRPFNWLATQHKTPEANWGTDRDRQGFTIALRRIYYNTRCNLWLRSQSCSQVQFGHVLHNKITITTTATVSEPKLSTAIESHWDWSWTGLGSARKGTWLINYYPAVLIEHNSLMNAIKQWRERDCGQARGRTDRTGVL